MSDCRRQEENARHLRRKIILRESKRLIFTRSFASFVENETYDAYEIY